MRTRGCVTLVCLLALLAFAGQARASGITNSSEDLRTGWYPNEGSITPGLVTGGTFGKEWEAHVQGQVYAQPLLDGSTLLVATEKNKVYGLDPATGHEQWSTTLPHSTPWNPGDIGCADLTPGIGVTGTPVIDPETGIAYMTHKTYASGSSGPASWWMDAINMSTHAEQPGFPVELGGEAQNLPGLNFDATDELQRPGLLLMEGVVYAGFGSDCDHDPYQGWVFGVSESGPVKARWATTEDGGGIWQSGAGLTSDGAGRILLATGNGFDLEPPIPGSTPVEGTFGQSVVRLQVQGNGTLKAADFFTPYNANSLNTWDADFGSGGVTGLPSPYFGTTGAGGIPHLAVIVGKDGYVYLLNRDNLGGYGLGDQRRRQGRAAARPERRRLVSAGRLARRRRLGLHTDRLRRPQRRGRIREPRRLPLRPDRRRHAQPGARRRLARRLRLLLRGPRDHLQRNRIRLRGRLDRVVPERVRRRLGTARLRGPSGQQRTGPVVERTGRDLVEVLHAGRRPRATRT